MKYDLIIFDLGNVVINFDHAISAAKISNRFGLDKNYVYNLFFDSQITQLHDEGKFSGREFYHKVKELLNIDIGFNEFKDCWNDIFVTNKGIERVIKELKKGRKVYLMSNTNKLHFDFIKNKFKVIKAFDKIILSFEVGKRKPHPKIYKHALRLAKTTPQRTLYIDDRADLVEGAIVLGIDAILFKNLRQLKKDLSQKIKNQSLY